MSPLNAIAERCILEAQARGEFTDLPGAGAPLALDDVALVPEELRAAYRILRNAGYLPPELATSREIREAEQLLAAAEDVAERSRIIARIEFLLARAGDLHRSLAVERDYYERIAERVALRRGKASA